MNVNAKQVNSIDYHGRMDITTVLGFFTQIKSIIVANNTLATAHWCARHRRHHQVTILQPGD